MWWYITNTPPVSLHPIHRILMFSSPVSSTLGGQFGINPNTLLLQHLRDPLKVLHLKVHLRAQPNPPFPRVDVNLHESILPDPQFHGEEIIHIMMLFLWGVNQR
ncbi:hypothetical protein AA313_de0204554 [Arthrobotrys entomopaga]|nr:hypothetical protein AA313_de0204554 [Arthrobotrys entomopaga]